MHLNAIFIVAALDHFRDDNDCYLSDEVLHIALVLAMVSVTYSFHPGVSITHVYTVIAFV